MSLSFKQAMHRLDASSSIVFRLGIQFNLKLDLLWEVVEAESFLLRPQFRHRCESALAVTMLIEVTFWLIVGALLRH